jgi:hypothetical protein
MRLIIKIKIDRHENEIRNGITGVADDVFVDQLQEQL